MTYQSVERPVDRPITCLTCGEQLRQGSGPCRCTRRALTTLPGPMADETTPECEDSQHYACHGYFPPERPEGTWLRCPCGCHRRPEPRPRSRPGRFRPGPQHAS
jgi:hypothetical protein